MSCSTDIGLQTLKLLENKVKSELAGFTAGAGGLIRLESNAGKLEADAEL